jgi:hypothetical protein
MKLKSNLLRFELLELYCKGENLCINHIANGSYLLFLRSCTGVHVPLLFLSFFPSLFVCFFFKKIYIYIIYIYMDLIC